jgi:shikimate dehydrogenase
MPTQVFPSGAAAQLFIFGWPLSYTRSPAFQTAAIRAAGLDAAYGALACPDARSFRRLFRALAASPQFLGGNVTNPYKVEALKLVDGLSPEARAIGAVNTLVRRGGRWWGYNTDAEGFVRAARKKGLSLEGKKVLLLGAGGAARALAWACGREGAGQLTVLARRPMAARSCARRMGKKGRSGTLTPATVRELSRTADLVIQTLPGSALGKLYGSSLSQRTGGQAWAVDIAYASAQTAFESQARRKGWKAFNGLGMLLEQGALAFELWFKRKPAFDAMQRALRKL